ncbi:MAG: P-loop NTPase [Desulfosalsimonadaceae bacterium]|nr:P-loop NTPase [Desulfosalsimonadaceae bacterium]
MTFRKTTIIPIASGKGGVGKSLFTANLSIALAQKGHSVIAIDLDLGGSNLYTHLGVPNTFPGIGDFLKSGDCDFNHLLVDTGISNLQFIPGDGRTPFMANIDFKQRSLLVNHIKNLSARFILLDLGAGSVFNTLNFFGLAQRSIVITTFETPAIMNFVMFLRNFIFRMISGLARQNQEVLKLVVDSFQQPINAAPVTVTSLLKGIDRIDPFLASKIQQSCNQYHPRIIFNMGDHPDELKIAYKIDNTLKRGLAMEAEFFGFVNFDETVRKSAKRKEVLMVKYPQSRAAQCIRKVAGDIENYWDKPFSNNISRLEAETRQKFETATAENYVTALG